MSSERYDGLKDGDFGILIRKAGFVDRYLRAVAHPGYPREQDDTLSMTAWATSDAEEMQRFETLNQACFTAATFAEEYGAKGYRFAPVQRKIVPTWLIAGGFR